MSKAGKADGGLGGLGREHPSPESIPHLSQQVSNSGTSSTPGTTPGLTPTISHGASGSPVKESSILQRGMSIDDTPDTPTEEVPAVDEPKGIPIKK